MADAPAASTRPTTTSEFGQWLAEKFDVKVDQKMEAHYDAVVLRTKAAFEELALWKRLPKELHEWNDAYFGRTHYSLLAPEEVILQTKPFASFIDKMLRRNVLENASWPDPPGADGWWLPPDWMTRTNDLVRTSIRVKYLDGVAELVDRLRALAEEEAIATTSGLRATPEGYYAAHVYFRTAVSVPRREWDTERREMTMEIHVTTQAKEVITELLHRHYAVRRLSTAARDDWQWSYRSEEFAANYLGHILHYVEGMVMELRDRPEAAE